LLILVTVALAACSSSAGGAPTTTAPVKITTTTVHYVPRYVIVAGHRVKLPVEEHNDPISSYSSFGQNVIITKGGFAPHKLYAQSKTSIVFTNLTDKVQEVIFHDFPNVSSSGPIRPAGSFSFQYQAAINVGYSNRSGSWGGLLYIGGCPPNCTASN
jgi:hypothetical protein